jgi:hypothetical protein
MMDKARPQMKWSTTIIAALSSAIGLLSTVIFRPVYEKTGEHGLLIGFVCAISFGGIVYFFLQFVSFWQASRSFRRTILHYLRVYRRMSPILVIICATLLLFLTGLAVLTWNLGLTVSESLPHLIVTFMLAGTVLSFWLLFGIAFWYRKYTSRARLSSLPYILSRSSGLSEFGWGGDKNEMLYHQLYSLKDCSFILLWGLNLGSLFGRPDSLKQLYNFLKENTDTKLYVLLHSPFCEEVTERAIEMGYSYDHYITHHVESISSCLALGSKRVQIALTHGRPSMRVLLWGRFGKEYSYDAMCTAADPMEYHDHSDSHTRYLRAVEWGGFMIQEYPSHDTVFIAPLYKGSTITHGGMWNAVRLKFAQEFTAGIQPNLPLSKARREALGHFAHDFGISRRKTKKATVQELSRFIEEQTDYVNYIRRIEESTRMKIILTESIDE